mgnify:CR=1 FL=1
MYNIYLEEKRQKEIEDKLKKESVYANYRKKFKSKTKNKINKKLI